MGTAAGFRLDVPGSVARGFVTAAKRRGLTPRELAATLLTVIARDGLVDAVLDDGDER